MKYAVKKLDARFNGYPHFSHYITIGGTVTAASGYRGRISAFVHLREWFWTNFGPSRELKFVNEQDCADLGWSWDSEHNMRIYVREKELNWFLLKWVE